MAFFCNWCTYTAADLAGRVAHEVRRQHRAIIRVMCSGRVDPQFVLDAFAKGADGVLIGGCHPGDCHYAEGNYKALRRVPDAEADAHGHGHRGRALPPGVDLRRRGREGQARRSTTWWRRSQALGPLGLPRPVQGMGSTRWSTLEADGRRLKEVDPCRINRKSPSTGAPPAAAARNPSWTWPRTSSAWSDAVDIVFWPVAMDFKQKDVEAMPDGSIVATLAQRRHPHHRAGGDGAPAAPEEPVRDRLRRLRAHRRHPGPGQPVRPREQILKFVYEDSPSTSERGRRRGPSTKFQENGRDRHAAGAASTSCARSTRWSTWTTTCPAARPRRSCCSRPRRRAARRASCRPRAPCSRPDIALCEECPRKDTKPTDLAFTEFKRPHQVLIDPEKCLLAQGVVCMGPATRGGCEALCIQGNMPCTGCFGPTSRVRDQGAKILSSLCSNVAAEGREGDRHDARQASPIRWARSTATAWPSFLRRKSTCSEGPDRLVKSIQRGARATPHARRRRTITIDPITRLEGHGKIDIFLDDKGDVERAYFQVPELRGFEVFSHRPAGRGHAADHQPHLRRLPHRPPHGRRPRRWTTSTRSSRRRPARKIRELVYNTFMLEDHALHVYILGGPDFIVGPDAPGRSATSWA